MILLYLVLSGRLDVRNDVLLGPHTAYTGLNSYTFTDNLQKTTKIVGGILNNKVDCSLGLKSINT
jgi:hypothetical protein